MEDPESGRREFGKYFPGGAEEMTGWGYEVGARGGGPSP